MCILIGISSSKHLIFSKAWKHLALHCLSERLSIIYLKFHAGGECTERRGTASVSLTSGLRSLACIFH